MPDIERQAYQPKDKHINQIPVRKTQKFVKFNHLDQRIKTLLLAYTL